jgi:hypothetical protein
LHVTNGLSEILKLKAAKQSGWLTAEEFDAELKRIIMQVLFTEERFHVLAG